MRMNFDQAPARRGTDSVKWDCLEAEFNLQPGDDILPLWVADMDFFCAPELLDAVCSAFSPGAIGYRTLNPHFYTAIADWMQTRHGLAVSPESILPSPGVVAGISAAIAAFTAAGDGIIVQPPIYPPFVHVTCNMGRVVRENKLIEHNDAGTLRYEIDFDDLRRLAADPCTKMMILCSPHNPTGRLYTYDELAEIYRICSENDVYLVSDEIHSDIMLGGAKFTPALLAAEGGKRILQLGSPSKSFNAAGTHSAYMIVPDAEERAQIRRFWDTLHMPTASFMSTEVITAAYGPAAYYADELCVYLTENMSFLRKYLREHIPEIRLTDPDSTYLLWADFRGCGIPSDEIFRRLCDVARVVPDPGEWFSPDYLGYMRINVAMPRAMLAEAAERIVRAIKNK